MSGAAFLERPLREDKIKGAAECEADLSKMRDADKAETLVEDERPRIISVHAGRSRASQGVHSGHMGNRSFRQNEVARCRRRGVTRALTRVQPSVKGGTRANQSRLEERSIQQVRGLARGERVYGARTSIIAETDLALWSASRRFILTAI